MYWVTAKIWSNLFYTYHKTIVSFIRVFKHVRIPILILSFVSTHWSVNHYKEILNRICNFRVILLSVVHTRLIWACSNFNFAVLDVLYFTKINSLHKDANTSVKKFHPMWMFWTPDHWLTSTSARKIQFPNPAWYVCTHIVASCKLRNTLSYVGLLMWDF
jgi:hypothetical protein